MLYAEDSKTPKQDANREVPTDKVVGAKQDKWIRENVDAIAAYNDFVEENGVAWR